jgi:hypothetical protein
VVEFLPSKQAVAGSSPVSRSLHETVSLQALLEPVENNQPARGTAEGGFAFGEKARSDVLPHNPCNVLPLGARDRLPRLLPHLRLFSKEKVRTRS